MSKLEKIAIIPDIHADDHDPQAISLLCKILKDIKPDRLIFLGDVLDFGWCSSYPHNQATMCGAFQRERVAWRAIFRRIHAACGTQPRAQVLQGNHEFRFQKGFMWYHPEFVNFRGLGWNEIIGVPGYHIEFVPNCKVWLAGRHFLVTHGKLVRKWSAFSAKAEFDDRGVSGASGHTHRMGQYFRTFEANGQTYIWTECGHLSNNPPHYGRPNEGRANWQLGFAVMAVNNSEYRLPTLIPFWKRGSKLRARYQDKEYGV